MTMMLKLCAESDISVLPVFFFFNDTATTEIYTLSLHDALPISANRRQIRPRATRPVNRWNETRRDRKSTRLNSSHVKISYAVFCLKKKKKNADMYAIGVIRAFTVNLSSCCVNRTIRFNWYDRLL